MCKADSASNSQKGQDTSILGTKLDKLSRVFFIDMTEFNLWRLYQLS